MIFPHHDLGKRFELLFLLELLLLWILSFRRWLKCSLCRTSLFSSEMSGRGQRSHIHTFCTGRSSPGSVPQGGRMSRGLQSFKPTDVAGIWDEVQTPIGSIGWRGGSGGPSLWFCLLWRTSDRWAFFKCRTTNCETTNHPLSSCHRTRERSHLNPNIRS